MSSNTKSGFTLIELLLYLGIVSIIVILISVFLLTVLSARVKNQTIAEVNGQATQVIQMMTQTIRNATAINTPAPGTGSSSLSLAIADVTKNPTIFDLLSGVIRITEGVGAPIALTSSRVVLSGFSIQNLSRPNTPGTIRIQFTIAHTNPDKRIEYNYSKTYYASASLR